MWHSFIHDAHDGLDNLFFFAIFSFFKEKRLLSSELTALATP